MTQKKSYSRYFIILQEDEKGYALASDKLPSGYAKLEIKNDKCKISYYVQNLKKESAPYHMILVCNKKDMKKLIKVGELNIDDHGRADVCYEYGVENVANCGINVDKVVGAAIVRFMNSNIIPVMSGFASTEIPEWKGFPLIEDELKRQETEVNKVEVETVKVVEKIEEEPRNIFEEYEKKIEEVKVKEEQYKEVVEVKEILGTAKVVEGNSRDNKNTEEVEAIQDEKDNSSREKKETKLEDINEELEDSRHKCKKSKNEVCEIKVEIECKEEKEAKVENKCEEHHKHEEKCEHDNHDHHSHHNDEHDDGHSKGSVGAFFKELSEGFEEMTNVCGEIKRCKWYKVPVHRPEEMMHCADYNKHTVVYYPMINYYPYIKRYSHFMLGYKYDRENNMKYLVYAIPGTKSRLDQPFGGRSGFVTWVPMNVGDEREDSSGYWLMFYDFRNSTIVIPVK